MEKEREERAHVLRNVSLIFPTEIVILFCSFFRVVNHVHVVGVG